MMHEELGLEKIETRNILKSSVIVGVTTGVGSVIPLLPFFFVNHMIIFQEAVIVSIVISAISLFTVDTYQALTLVGTWWKSGLRMVIIGMSAAIAGYLLAKLFHAQIMK